MPASPRSGRVLGRALVLAAATFVLGGCTYIGGSLLLAGSGGGSGAAATPAPGLAQITAARRTRASSVPVTVRLPAHTTALEIRVHPQSGSSTLATITQASLGSPGLGEVTGLPDTADTLASVDLTWDSQADLGGPGVEVVLSVRATGPGGAGAVVSSSPMTVGDSAPEAVFDIPAPQGLLRDAEIVRVVLFDAESDPVDLALTYEATGGPSGSMTPVVPTTLTGLRATPRSQGGLQVTFFWETTVDLAPGPFRDVLLRATPNEAGGLTGTPAEVRVDVDNNSRPLAAMDEPVVNPDRAGRTAIGFTLFDDERDPLDVFVQWRLAGEPFPSLQNAGDLSDRRVRRSLLSDPERRRELQLVTEAGRGELSGTADAAARTTPPLGPDELQASKLLETGALGGSTLLDRTLELLCPAAMAPLSAPLASPGALADEPAGDTVLVGLATGDLVRVDLLTGTTSSTPVATGLGAPVAIVVNATGTAAYIVNETGTLWAVDLAGAAGPRQVTTGLLAPGGLALLGASAAVVTTGRGTKAGALKVVDLATGATHTAASGMDDPRGVAVAPDRRFAYVAERGPARVLSVDLSTGAAVTLAPRDAESVTLTGCHALSLEPDGRRLLCVLAGAGSDRVVEIDLATGAAGDRFTDLQNVGGAVARPDGGFVATVSTTAPTAALWTSGTVRGRYRIVGTSLRPPRVKVDRPFQPALTGGARWRIAATRGTLGLESSPTGTHHALIWDTLADEIPEEPVELRVVPFDAGQGTEGVTRISKVFELFDPVPADRAPATDALPDPTATAAVQHIALGDLDGDGSAELVTARRVTINRPGQPKIITGEIRVRQQQEPGTFATTTTATLVFPSTGGGVLVNALALGDPDRDGDLDIAAAYSTNLATSTIVVHVQTGTFSFPTGARIVLAPGDQIMSSPADLAWADLDRDGQLDLVSANSGSDNLTIFWGQAGGLDPTPTVVATPNAPKRIVVADLDGDGTLDLACGSLSARSIAVISQISTRTFDDQSPRILQVKDHTGQAVAPTDLVAGDLDGDGDVDLAVSFYLTAVTPELHGVAVFRQGPGGVETAPSVTLVPGTAVLARPIDLTLSDWDQDGDLDLLVTGESSGTVVLYRQRPPSGLRSQVSPDAVLTLGLASGQTVQESVAADLDGDGRDDLVVNAAREVFVFRRPSTGAFANQPLVKLGSGVASARTPGALRAADMDADGLLDIVTANSTSRTVTIFPQTDPGTYQALPDLVFQGNLSELTSRVDVADLDADGRLDVLAGAKGIGITAAATSVRILLQTASGTFDQAGSQRIMLDDASSRAALGDLDQDGDLDLVIAQRFDIPIGPKRVFPAGLYIFRQGPPGQLETTPSITVATSTEGWTHVVAIDVDADGDLDLAGANGDTDSVSIFRQTAPGVFEAKAWVEIPVSPTPGVLLSSIVLADLDRDGDLDLAAANLQAQTVTLWRQTAPGVFESKPFATLSIDRPGTGFVTPRIAIGDVDGDGDADVVAITTATSEVLVYRQRAPGVFETSPRFRLQPDPLGVEIPQAILLQDLDGDGEPDLATANFSAQRGTSSITIFSQSGP